MRKGFILQVVSWGLVAACAVARADWDTDFVHALRARHLYSIAESVCRERFASSSEPRAAAQWAVEGLKTTAGWALQSPADQSDAIWQRGQQLWVDAFQERFPESPWRRQVELQQGLNDLAQAESLRMQAEVSSDRKNLRLRALAQLRVAERRLRELANDLEASPPSRDTSMSPAVVQGLQNQTTLALAKVYWNRALCYPDKSDDRLAALELARRRVDELVRQTRPEDALQATAILWRARCLRELGDLPAAQAALQVLVSRRDLDPRQQLERDAERLAVAHAAHAKSLPIQPEFGRSIDGQRSPLWDLAVLRIWLDRLALSDSSEAQEIQRTIEDGIATIELVHGPYWGRLATQMMVGHIKGVANVASAGLLERSARERLGQQRWREAAELLKQAAEAAARGGAPSEAFRLSYQAALVEQQQGEWQRAATQLRDLSLRWRTDPRAAQAHLLAIWSLRHDADSKSDPVVLAWLDEQINVWPKAAATSRARVWLANWLQARGQLDDALKVLQQVDLETEAANDAVALIFSIWTQRIEQAADRQQQLELLRKYFAELLTGAGESAAEAIRRALRLCEWQLRASLGDDLTASEQGELRQWLDDPGNKSTWLEAAKMAAQLLLSEPNIDADKISYQSISFDQIRWFALLWLQWQEAADGRAEQRALAVADAMGQWLSTHPDADPSRRIFLSVTRAEAYRVGHRPEDARRLLEQLMTQHPDRIDVRRAWARFLQSSDKATDWERAEQAWRRLAARAKPGSELWYEAKYGVAKCLLKQGKKKECRDRIAYLRATRGFGSGVWPARFEALWKESQ